ncbi:MAG: hypothetical protein C4524_12610, partial [Candidatus Zixiibacteriota bacterium]
MTWQRIIILAAVLLALAGAQDLRAETAHLYRISLQDHGSAVELAGEGITILAAIPNDHALAELTDAQMTRVIRLGYAVDYLAASLYEYSAQDETDDYYTYTSLSAQLQAWATQYPAITSLQELGVSWQNRVLWAVKVSDNPGLDEDEIVCFFCGVHHGNEKISAEVPMYFLNYLLTNYGTNPDVTYYVDNREIWVFPVVNPDGYVANSRYNNHNVDVNRNYSFHWGQSASNYGPYPFSEPEAQAVRDLNLSQYFTTGHSYHSYGEEILYPFAWASNHPSPDNAFFVSLVNAMCAYNGYQPLISGNLYPHGGEMNDYLYGEKGVMSVTTELWSGPGYNPPTSGILAVCQENLPTDMYMLQRAGGAQITGRITDSATGQPLVAQFKVVQLWNPNEIYPRYSEPSFGRYRHLVVPGTYTLEVSKLGYATQTIPGIVVSGTNPTVRDVALVFAGWPNIDITLTPQGAPIQIPVGGGSFNFDATIANNSGASQTYNAWIMMRQPSGQMQGPMLGPLTLTSPAGAGITRSRSQNIPGTAAPGTYTYIGYVGNYNPLAVYDSSYFTFTKLSGTDASRVDNWDNWGESFDQETEASTPAGFALVRAYPNPFNPATTIGYQLPAHSRVSLRIYDTAGREVAALVDGWREAGLHEVTFNASGLPSGIY